MGLRAELEHAKKHEKVSKCCQLSPLHTPEVSKLPTSQSNRNSHRNQDPSLARASVIPRILSCAILTWTSFCCLPLSAQTAAPATLTSPAPGSVLPGSSPTFTWTPGTGVTAYFLSLGTNGAGSANLWESGSTTATSVTATGLPTNGTAMNATLFSMIAGTWEPVYYTYTEMQRAPPAPLAALTSPMPGTTLPGSSVTFNWTTDANATAYFLSLGTKGPGSANLWESGSTTATSVTVNSLPINGTIMNATLFSKVNGAWHPVYYTFTEAIPPAVLSSLACTNASITGSGTDSCTATLNSPASGAGMVVTLTGNNSSVTVPTSVLIAAGSMSAVFVATVSSVSTAQTVALTASAAGVSQGFSLQLIAANPTLTTSASTISFGTVAVNTSTSQTLTLSSTGNVPVTVNSVALTGAGFTLSGGTFPSTLSPGQTVTLSVVFDPTAAGSTSGQLVIGSTSSMGGSATVTLTGTGAATLTAISCSSASMTGSGTDACTVTLNVAAPTGGVIVNLSSNNGAVAVPASVTVVAGSATAAFTANVSVVSTAQATVLTASTGGISKTFDLQLNAGTATLTVNKSSIAFGEVILNTPTTQTVSLSSSGNLPVTVSSTTLTGAGFTVSGATFPVTLIPSVAVTLSVVFDPTTVGATTGLLTVTSNSSTGTTAKVSLSGTGEAAVSYQVDLSWTAPNSPEDPIAGYNVYRALSGGSIYQLMIHRWMSELHMLTARWLAGPRTTTTLRASTASECRAFHPTC